MNRHLVNAIAPSTAHKSLAGCYDTYWQLNNFCRLHLKVISFDLQLSVATFFVTGNFFSYVNAGCI